MNAIIIAAGMGRRMGPMTRELPKCLAISWKGRTLFETQLETLRQCGITDIAVVRGYQGEKFPEGGLRYFWNRDFEHNNILESLMCAREALRGETLVLYSDIWYEPRVVQALAASKADLAVTVDLDWKLIYDGRTDHPLSEAETVTLDKNQRVKRIGKIAAHEPEAHGEFTGMMKLSRPGAEIFINAYERTRKDFEGKPFQRARVFRQAYLTDLLQYLADTGTGVEAVTVRGGWREIDTIQDFENLITHLEQHHSGKTPVKEKT